MRSGPTPRDPGTEDATTFAAGAVEPRGQDFYTRSGNPNHAQAAAVVAELEGTEGAMVTASGMAAITTAVLALVSSGDHVIGQKSTYGGTASVLLNLLPRLGVSTTLVDQRDPEEFEKALTSKTRLILVETPSNPLLQITDLRAVAGLARAHGVLTLADNTFATPLNQRPADFGIDVVWHSATKYLNGHSDVSAGVLAGPAKILDRIWDTSLLTGATLGPTDPWLLLRGIRTLPLRVPRHNDNGLALAEALSSHPAVTRVHYPAALPHLRRRRRVRGHRTGRPAQHRQQADEGGLLRSRTRRGCLSSRRTRCRSRREARQQAARGQLPDPDRPPPPYTRTTPCGSPPAAGDTPHSHSET
ncbi:trans-sulfuration enzyme family protein [Streptomyces sp. NPDC007875]|uniref:trans-sulfuration enzyme family protein n=1 Tax=Streptomyces sp. NPDC007875 TaxID=3364783 RepID=UPI0036B1EDEC